MEYIYSKVKSPKVPFIFLMLALVVPVFMVPATTSAMSACDNASQTIVGDTSTLKDGSPAVLVATPYNSRWTVSIPDSTTWIWGEDPITDTVSQTSETFTRTFDISGAPLGATLDIAADNSYDVSINGHVVGADATEFNYQNVHTYSISAADLLNGSNAITFTVTNWAMVGGTMETNPAGLLYKLTVNSNDCQTPPTPTDVCPNIDGIQATIPNGDQLVDGNCIPTIVPPSNYCPLPDEQNGWFGQYYNEPSTDIGMELPDAEWGTSYGNPLGSNSATWTADWYDTQFYRFSRVDSNLMFGSSWFPFDSAPEQIQGGHEFDFAAHWSAKVTAPSTNDYAYNLSSDDDAWVYVDGALIVDNSGVHPTLSKSGNINLTAGTRIVDIYFAERHVVQSEMSFEFADKSLIIKPYNPLCEETAPVCNPDINLIANGSFENPTVTNSALWDIFNFGTTPSLAWLASWIDSTGAPQVANVEVQKTGLNGWNASSGIQWAELDGDWFGPSNPSLGHPAVAISQDIVTIPSDNYTVSFDFSARPGTADTENKVEVLANNVLIGTVGPTDGTSLSNTAWTSHSVNFTAASALTTITLRDAGTPNDSLGTFVDNVSAKCVSAEKPTTGTIQITKYECPAGTTVTRALNGPSETDINNNTYAVPSGCTLQKDAKFGYTYDASNSTNNTGPYLGLSPDTTLFVPFVLTDVNGVTTINDAATPGRYIIAELDSSGNQLPSADMLSLYCYGDGDTSTTNDNQEITFSVAGKVSSCVAYNKAPVVVAPTLKLVKVVVGGQGTSADWQLSAVHEGDVNNFTDLGNSSVVHSITAGVYYALSESPVGGFNSTGYTASDWSCVGSLSFDIDHQAINLNSGDSATCTITNTFESDNNETNNPGVTTNPATLVIQTSATVNGTNGPVAADNTSFWWGTSSIGPLSAAADASSQFPSSGWSHDSGLGSALAGGLFNEALIGLTPNTQYYFVAWSRVGGVWYPGAVLNFTTAAPATVPTDVCPNIDDVQTEVPGGKVLENGQCVIDEDARQNTSSSNPTLTFMPGSTHRDISGLFASANVGGEVAGASTGPGSACEEYLKSYIKLGANNDPEEVKKLQIFLNQFFEVKNPVTGFYGPITFGMVKKFQTHQNVAVLTPWSIAGFPTDGPTGFVYKTTRRWINILKCPESMAGSPFPSPLVPDFGNN